MLYNNKKTEHEELYREFKSAMTQLGQAANEKAEKNTAYLALQRELYATQKLLQEQTNIATDCMSRTIQAERHQRKLEETVRITQTQRKKELFKFRKDIESLIAENEKAYNNSNMEVEDFLGKVAVFKELNNNLEMQLTNQEGMLEKIDSLEKMIVNEEQKLVELKSRHWDSENTYKIEINKHKDEKESIELNMGDINKNLEEVINDLRRQAKERANLASEEQKKLRLEVTEWKGKAMRAEKGSMDTGSKKSKSKKSVKSSQESFFQDKATQTKVPAKRKVKVKQTRDPSLPLNNYREVDGSLSRVVTEENEEESYEDSASQEDSNIDLGNRSKADTSRRVPK